MLQYGATYSCCLRRAAGGVFSGGYAAHLRAGHASAANPLAGGPATSHTTQVALCAALRCKSSSVRIANRKKVEMFVAKRYHLPTRLQTAAPDIAREWNYEKNPMHLYPEIVSIGYMYPVWWTCKACGHSYKMSVEKRVVRGGGCSACEEKEVNQTMAHNKAFMERHLENVGGSEEGTAGTDLAQSPQLLPGEENRALRPKRSTMLNLRTKY